MLLLQEICQYTEFTVCHLQLRMATKWIEIGQGFQIWTQWIPKLSKMLLWKNSVAVFFGLKRMLILFNQVQTFVFQPDMT